MRWAIQAGPRCRIAWAGATGGWRLRPPGFFACAKTHPYPRTSFAPGEPIATRQTLERRFGRGPKGTPRSIPTAPASSLENLLLLSSSVGYRRGGLSLMPRKEAVVIDFSRLVATAFAVVAMTGPVDSAVAVPASSVKWPNQIVAQTTLVVRGHLPSRKGLRVVLTVHSRRRWITVDTASIGMSGRFVLRWKVPGGRSVIALRVVAAAGTRTRTIGSRRYKVTAAPRPPQPSPGGSPSPAAPAAPVAGSAPSSSAPTTTPAPGGRAGGTGAGGGGGGPGGTVSPSAPTTVTQTSTGGPLNLSLGALTVQAPAGAINPGDTLTIANTDPSSQPPTGAPSLVGGPFSVSTSQGDPSRPVTVALRYDPAGLGAAGQPLLLHRFHGTGPWIPEPTTVDTLTHTASATVDSFSPMDWANSAVYYTGLFTGNRSDLPDDCVNAPSWVQDLELPYSHEVPLPVCFSCPNPTQCTGSSKAVLHLRNNRGYAMRINAGGSNVTADFGSQVASSLEGQFAEMLASLASSGAPTSFVLAPGADVWLTFPKPPDQPAPQDVYIAPVLTPTGSFSSVAWALLTTTQDAIGLPVGFADCVISSVYNVGTAGGDTTSELDQLNNCATAAERALTESKRKVLQKITYALISVQLLQRVADIRSDALFPPQIGFTISGTGLTNPNIRVTPRDLGTIVPGQTYHVQLSASGGTAPYDYRIYTGAANGGRRPTWATVNSTGLLTLSPPSGQTGYFKFYVYVFDHSGQHSPFARDAITFGVGGASTGSGPFDRPPPEVISVDANGQPGVGWSYGGRVSRDGSLVWFVSTANLVNRPMAEEQAVYVRDRAAGTTSRIDLPGVADGAHEVLNAISPSGRYAYISTTWGVGYLYDLTTGQAVPVPRNDTLGGNFVGVADDGDTLVFAAQYGLGSIYRLSSGSRTSLTCPNGATPSGLYGTLTVTLTSDGWATLASEGCNTYQNRPYLLNMTTSAVAPLSLPTCGFNAGDSCVSRVVVDDQGQHTAALILAIPDHFEGYANDGVFYDGNLVPGTNNVNHNTLCGITATGDAVLYATPDSVAVFGSSIRTPQKFVNGGGYTSCTLQGATRGGSVVYDQFTDNASYARTGQVYLSSSPPLPPS